MRPLAFLTDLFQLKLEHNLIEDLSPLIANSGLGGGEEIDLTNNPLSDQARNEQIPALASKGRNRPLLNQTPALFVFSQKEAGRANFDTGDPEVGSIFNPAGRASARDRFSIVDCVSVIDCLITIIRIHRDSPFPRRIV